VSGIPFRSGYAAVLGRPNVGKSTLVNRVLKEKISIVTSKPQTTRNRVLGILTTDDHQLLFLDTPGVHDRKRAGIDGFMIDEAFAAMGEADVLLLVTEADAPHARDRAILERIAASGRPKVAAINKIDRVKDKRLLLPRIDALAKEGFDEVVPIRATTGDGVDRLVDALVRRLPEGPAYFPADQLTDQTLRFVAAEIVREKVFLAARDEVPYATAVRVEEYADRPDGSAYVRAAVLVERESQKGIVIGKGGEMLRRIGADARREIETLHGGKVFLELVVQVRKNWTQDETALRELGYRRG
jgi:GTP-binding protein Era